MHDHVIHYDVNTSCWLAYLLSFSLMAGKRKFRLVVLLSASKKAKRTVTNLGQVLLGTKEKFFNLFTSCAYTL